MTAAAAPDLTSTDSPARAVIYARVSRDTAGGRSVEEQQGECRAECERQGWAVADVLVDNDISASRYSTKDRPEYARLRAILRPGDVLVTWEASRAQRDLARYVELRDLCAERGVFWSYSGRLFDLRDGDDRFATGLDALLAEKEAEQTRSRILRAHRANLAAGKPHGRVPYGYRVVRDPETGKSIGREPHPVEAPLLQEAARRVLDGQSSRSVLAWINEITAGTGWRWNLTTLKDRLCNPVYAGYRTHDERITGPGTWEGLWDLEAHDNLVAMYAARSTGTQPRGSEPRYLLTGIATCAVCGDKLQRAKVKGVSTVSCPGRHLGRKMETIDAVVTRVIESVLSTPEALAAMADSSSDTAAVTAARAQLAELQKRLEAVEEQIIDGTMPAATGARITTRLSEQIAEAEAAAAPVFTSGVVADLAAAPDPVATWRTLPLTAKREFIRTTMTIKVHRIGKGRWHDPEAGIVIDPRRPFPDGN